MGTVCRGGAWPWGVGAWSPHQEAGPESGGSKLPDPARSLRLALELQLGDIWGSISCINFKKIKPVSHSIVLSGAKSVREVRNICHLVFLPEVHFYVTRHSLRPGQSPTQKALLPCASPACPSSRQSETAGRPLALT